MTLRLELKNGVLRSIDPEDPHTIYTEINSAILTIRREIDHVPITYDISEAVIKLKEERFKT